jgi:hypothetical protein
MNAIKTKKLENPRQEGDKKPMTANRPERTEGMASESKVKDRRKSE